MTGLEIGILAILLLILLIYDGASRPVRIAHQT